MEYTIGIICGIAAMIFFGASNFLIKGAMKHTDAVTFGTIRAFATTSLLLFYASLTTGIIMPSKTTWIYILLFGIFGSLAYYTFSKAMKDGKVSVVVPIVNAHSIITILLAALILGEILSFSAYAYITMILAGIILVSIQQDSHKKELTSHPIILALTTFFIWGVIFLFYRFISSDIGPMMAGFYTEAAILLFFLPFFRPKKALEIPLSGWKIIISVSVLVATAIVAYNIGIYISYISIVSPISSAAGLVAVILGLVIYKETITWYNYLGIALIIGNIIMLSLI